MFTTSCERLSIVHNVIDTFGSKVGVSAVVGILAAGSSHVTSIAGNQVANIRRPDERAVQTGGILLSGPFEFLSIRDNQVQSAVPLQDDPRHWGVTVFELADLERNSMHVPNHVAIPVNDETVLTIDGSRAIALPRRFSFLSVAGNQVEAEGDAALNIQTQGACTLSGNQCYQMTSPPDGVSAFGIRVKAGQITVNANTVARAGIDLVTLNANDTSTVALGNASGDPIQLNGQPLPAPWLGLNIS
jgi:hypothetical protein